MKFDDDSQLNFTLFRNLIIWLFLKCKYSLLTFPTQSELVNQLFIKFGLCDSPPRDRQDLLGSLTVGPDP